MIPVTRPFLPPKEEYIELINGIWDRNWLTNKGPLVKELESLLKEYLGLDNFLFTGNGTIAIQLAIKAFQLKGEIITTPFSYVATTSSIVWENCIPIFSDIDRKRLTLDPNKIEPLITKKTSAILATHVYGLPCHVQEIEKIAEKYGLKVIYDGAHAFGTIYKGKSLLSYGDISTLSTHATKLFHTVEGGAVITSKNELSEKLEKLRNFGHAGIDNYEGVGINGKNSEFHAAMGLVNLKYVKLILQSRKNQYLYYHGKLKNVLEFIEVPNGTEYNYAYCPVIFKNEREMLAINKGLEKINIICRRYFYPPLNSLDYVTTNLETPIVDDVSKRILCLPLYHDLQISDQERIIEYIINNIN